MLTLPLFITSCSLLFTLSTEPFFALVAFTILTGCARGGRRGERRSVASSAHGRTQRECRPRPLARALPPAVHAALPASGSRTRRSLTSLVKQPPQERVASPSTLST